VDAVNFGLFLMYIGQKLPSSPLTDHTPVKLERNCQVRTRYAKGETVVELAEAFGISQQRISQILRDQRK
jgi:Mor family transcriptional regulator